MSETTDTARLLAQGAQVTLKDGSHRRVVLEGEYLAQIEDEYDGLEEFAETLRRKPFRTVARVFTLIGVPEEGVSEESVWKLLDTRRMNEYVEAIGDALDQALPEQKIRVRILQSHEVDGDRYRAGQVVEVSSGRARHLLSARVAKVVEEDGRGNGEAAPGVSLGAASSSLRSSSGGSRRKRSGG